LNKTTLISAGIVLALTATVGCSSGKPVDTSGSGQAKSFEPFKITMLNAFYTPEPPRPDDEALKLIEQYTNTKLNITWAPSAGYNEKTNVTLASGELPQILMVLDNKIPSIVDSVRAGQFWEVGPYLKDYPNLKNINSTVQYNTSYDGKTYGLYRSRWLARNGAIFRRDWLDNLGLKDPKTTDELYNVLKAFTFNDPDKNGKDDTFGLAEGLAEDGSSGTFSGFSAWMGGPNEWEDKAGKLSPAFMSDEYVATMNFFKRLYTEKIMNNDFAIAKKSNVWDYFNKSKAGMYFAAMDDGKSKNNDLFKLTPNAKIDVISKFSGPKGERVWPTGGYAGMLFFPKKSIKTENDLKQILAFLDKLDDKEMQDLLTWGIKDKHYKIENGVVKQTQEQIAAYISQVNNYKQLLLQFKDTTTEADEIPLIKKYKKMFDENIPVIVANPAEPFISKTYSERGNQLNKVINDARTKYIMGSLDDAGWKSAKDQWLKSGGDKIIEEYNAEYAKVKKP
jgi:putative aldouronate transport system substrate-binding protein